jgi:hypothetical protein
MENPIADQTTRKDNPHAWDRKERKSPTNRKKGIIQEQNERLTHKMKKRKRTTKVVG